MLSLISYGSSSKGNCHILYNGKSSLMLDCGINLRNMNYELKKYNIQGIMLSHYHKDHCKGLKEKTYLGNEKVYSNKETLEFLGDSVMEYRKIELQDLKPYKIGEDWIVIPISVMHDVPCFGYIIKDKLSGLNIAYLTDLGYSDNLIFQNINIWIVECNHIRNEIELAYNKSLEEEDSNLVYYSRVLSDVGHLSLEDSSKLIYNNICNGTKCVILCHISSSESDYKRYDKLYLDNLKSLGMENNSVLIHSINNRIIDCEEFEIIKKNKWEDIEL